MDRRATRSTTCRDHSGCRTMWAKATTSRSACWAPMAWPWPHGSTATASSTPRSSRTRRWRRCTASPRARSRPRGSRPTRSSSCRAPVARGAGVASAAVPSRTMTKPNTKAELLAKTVEHVDITAYDARPVIDAMRGMSFTSRDTARAADILSMAIEDPACSPWLTLAGSTSAGGCMHVYRDMIATGMADVVVATGASIVDMDFFEALGFKHYQAASDVDDRDLRALYIDRIYDTYIDEEELQACDHAIKQIADALEPRPYSSREFIFEMGRWLASGHAKKAGSLVQTAFEEGCPIFCPAFTDSSAGFGLVKHQVERMKAGRPYLTIDAVADFRELTDIKIAAGTTGLFMVGGGVPKNFAQDTVVCAEILGIESEMHKYAVQITVADVRDGACSSSTLKEACSWGKVDVTFEQMVFAEATTVVPLIASDAWHRAGWKTREKRRWAKLFAK